MPTTVLLSYDMQTLTGNFIPGWSGMVRLTNSVTMRHE
jgi:hypothetical protein